MLTLFGLSGAVSACLCVICGLLLPDPAAGTYSVWPDTWRIKHDQHPYGGKPAWRPRLVLA